MSDPISVITDHLRDLGMEDVARWVENPGAVRLLVALPHYAPNETCRDCGADVDESHGQTFDHPRNPQWCRIAAAWRALGDPRGQADIERAHEEALRQNVRLFPQFVTNGEPNDAPLVRLATALWRTTETSIAARDLRQPLWAARIASDARGMEAVEDEARQEAHVRWVRRFDVTPVGVRYR